MKKSNIAVSIPILGMLNTATILFLLQADSENFMLGLSSDYWAGFFVGGGISLMILLLFAHYKEPKNG
jgi:hypothetical protein